VMPYCREHAMALVAYSPFGSGRFPRSGSRGGVALAAVAAAHGVTTHQVALAFLLHQGAFVIPKTTSVEHVGANAAAASLALGADEIARIDEAPPRGPRRRGVPVI